MIIPMIAALLLFGVIVAVQTNKANLLGMPSTPTDEHSVEKTSNRDGESDDFNLYTTLRNTIFSFPVGLLRNNDHIYYGINMLPTGRMFYSQKT